MGRRRGNNRKQRMTITIEELEPGTLAPNPLNTTRAERLEPPSLEPIEPGADRREQLARDGRWPSSPPLGYLLDNETGVLEVDPAAAPLVQSIYALTPTLGSVNRVWRHLEDAGIKRPEQPSRPGRRGSGSFNKPILKRILTNPAYIGKIPIGDHVYPGRHMGIVPEFTFQQVQRILAASERRTANDRNGAHVYLLVDLLRCRCGQMMRTKRSGKVDHYYFCRGCGTGHYPAPDVEQALLEHVNGLLVVHTARQRGEIKDTLARHIEVIEWVPELGDPRRATMRLMPFADARAT